MRARYLLLAIAALVVALVAFGCGGSGIGTSFGRQPGIYFVDSGNNRMVWISDMNATFFTSLNSASSGVSNVVNGFVGSDGRIYLIDGTNDSIVRFDDIAGDGRVEFGSHGNGTGQFLNPVRVTVAGGSIYVVDRDRNALVKFAPNGSTWQILDLSTWFAASDEPDVTVDPTGHIYLAGGSKIVRLNGITGSGPLVYGTPGSGQGNFASLNGIALDDSGKIYVADGVNNRIVRISDMNGTGWAEFGSTGTTPGHFDIAFGVGVDHNGLIYVGDRNNHRIVRVNDMTGAGWVEIDNLPSGLLSFPLSVYPHLPTF